MYTVQLPPVVKPIAVNKYIIYIISYLLLLTDKFKKERYLGQTSNEWSDLKPFGLRTFYFKQGKKNNSKD